MQKLEQRFAGRSFAILAVNHGESKPKVAAFARRLALGLRVLLDPNQEAPRAWRVRLLPASFLVDAYGRVRFSVVGEIDWAGAEAVEVVRRLLPEPASLSGRYGLGSRPATSDRLRKATSF